MTPTVYQSKVLANVLSSNISMAITTSQATILLGGRPDRRYLFGVFSATYSTAKALGLSWSGILANSLGDLQELSALFGSGQDLGSKPLIHLILEIEAGLVNDAVRPQH